MIYQPKAPLIHLPPWSRHPLPSSRGLARRCCCEECFCKAGETISKDVEIELTITGIVNSNPVDCANCTDLNDTFMLDRSDFGNCYEEGEPGFPATAWVHEFAGACGMGRIVLRFWEELPSNFVEVTIRPSVDSSPRYKWRALENEFNCDALDVVLAFYSSSFPPNCDATASTCRVVVL